MRLGPFQQNDVKIFWRCLARHPSSTLKNLEVVVLMLKFEFMTCLGMLSSLECIWNVECFQFLCSCIHFKYHSFWMVFEIHSWKTKHTIQKHFRFWITFGMLLFDRPNISNTFQIWIAYGTFLECIWNVKQFVRVGPLAKIRKLKISA